MGGDLKLLGLVKIKLKIFSLEHEVWFFVVNNSHHQIILGLDLIKKFRLCQDHNLQISQFTEDISVPTFNTIPTRSQPTSELTSEQIQLNWNEYMPIEKFNADAQHLDKEKRDKIYDLIDEFKSLFAKDKYDVGTFNKQQAHITLSENKFIARRPYRCSFEDQKEIESQVAGLLQAGLIEDSCSPFAAPVTMAYRKSEGKRNRMCVDFRELNKLIVPESFPFPTIEDIIPRITDCPFLSTLDINSAFWSIPVHFKDRYKTGFCTQQGHYQWKVLPFGIKIASPVFQRILAGILRKHNLSSFCVNFMDDILIFSKSFEEHLRHLRAVFTAIASEGFRLKFLKCEFAKNKVKYLGHILEKNNISPLVDNVIAIRDFPIPQTKKHIRQFLGKVNFYHQYIPAYSQLLEPLHKILRKDMPFLWTEQCQEAFEKVKSYLISEPILAIFDRNKETNIYSDASLQGISAVLKQVQENGEEKPVAYFSKKLNSSQKKKKAVFLECLAIKEALKQWKYWLLGKHFKVFTDHKPLENFNIKVRPDEELGDMTAFFSEFDFDLIYRPGTENSEADCLSRNPVLPPDENLPTFSQSDQAPAINVLTLSEIQEDQKNIPALPNENFETKNKTRYITINGRNKVILSDQGCKLLVDRMHSEFGHIGYNHMVQMIQPFYFSKHLFKIIKSFTSSCQVCIKNKTRTHQRYGHMGHLGPASEPFQIVSLDTIGGLGGSSGSKQNYLHLLVDHFTRFAYVLPSTTQSTKDFIKIISRVQKNNKIQTLLTDHYGGLSSNEFENYLASEGITHIFTAIDAPFSNGLNERLNQTLTNRIRCRTNELNNKTSWMKNAYECTNKYNNTIHSATKFSPAYLMHGQFPGILPPELEQCHNLHLDRETAFKNSLHNHAQNKARFDKNRKDHTFQVGDLVYVENGNKLNRKKLDPIRIGPFPILEKRSDHVYLVDCGPSSREKRLFHISKIVPCAD